MDVLSHCQDYVLEKWQGFQMINHFLCFSLCAAKSPIFSQMTATTLGISTIRATQAGERLIHEFDDFQNVHSAVWQILMSLNTGGCCKAINAKKDN